MTTTMGSAERLSAVRPLPIGAEIDEDLSIPLAGADRERLRALFLEYGLLIFRGQSLSMDQQIDLLDCIGPVLHTVDGVGYISTEEGQGALGRSELIFHSDLDFSPHPLRAISLHAIDVVDDATSTRFASNRRAWRTLSEAARARIEPLSLVTALPDDYAQDNINRPIDDTVPQIARPPIVPHPDTGEPLLMVSQQAVRFEGMAPAESAALIRDLHGGLYAHDNVHEHFWRNGDIVIWDNIALQHARSALTAPGRRTLQRVVVGEASFFDVVADPQAVLSRAVTR